MPLQPETLVTIESNLPESEELTIMESFTEAVLSRLDMMYFDTQDVSLLMQSMEIVFYGQTLEIVDNHDNLVLDAEACNLFCDNHHINLGQLVAILSKFQGMFWDQVSGDFDIAEPEPPVFKPGITFGYVEAPMIPDAPKVKKKRKARMEKFFAPPPGTVLTVVLNKPKRRLG